MSCQFIFKEETLERILLPYVSPSHRLFPDGHKSISAAYLTAGEVKIWEESGVDQLTIFLGFFTLLFRAAAAAVVVE